MITLDPHSGIVRGALAKESGLSRPPGVDRFSEARCALAARIRAQKRFWLMAPDGSYLGLDPAIDRTTTIRAYAWSGDRRQLATVLRRYGHAAHYCVVPILLQAPGGALSS